MDRELRVPGGIAVRGRTRSQGCGGAANREVIDAVARSVSIPVIGNGGITCGAEIAKDIAGKFEGLVVKMGDAFHETSIPTRTNSALSFAPSPSWRHGCPPDPNQLRSPASYSFPGSSRKPELNRNRSAAEMDELAASDLSQIAQIDTDVEEIVQTIFKPVW